MLDIRLMLVIVSWSGILLLLAFWVGAGRRSGRGLGTWALALTLQTVSGVLLALRDHAPFWLSAVVGNALLVASCPLYTAATLEFFERRLPRAWLVGPPAFVVVAWVVLRDDYIARVQLAGLLLGLGELAPAVTLHRLGRQHRTAPQWLVMGGFGLFALLLFARLVSATVDPASIGGHLSGTPVQSATYVIANGFVLLTSVGFLLMHKEHAEQESDERKAALERLNGTLEQRVHEQVDEIVARSREVERLNAELREQVKARSDELARALSRLTRSAGEAGMLPPGTTLAGRFDIEAPLGRGGMGAVYRALDRVTGERVALKIITTESTGELDSMYRFLREAHASAQVNHPSIVHARHVDVAEGRLFIVFDLVDGVGLDTVLRTRRAFASGCVARFGAKLTEALAAAHAAGVVHRDVKPSNVMVTRGQASVRLLDFGISKMEDVARSDAELTHVGAIMGTPAYIAPEQVLSSAAAVDRSDMFAVGVMLFELLAGRSPFVAKTPRAQMALRVLGEAPSLLQLAPHVHPPLAALVQRCLAREPEDRPSAAEAAKALAAVADALGDPGKSLLDDPAGPRVEALDDPRAAAETLTTAQG